MSTGTKKNNNSIGTGSSACTLRPLSCELSCLHRADGSSLWKSGSTHVMAAVYGPIAPRLPMQVKTRDCDQAIVSVLIKSSPAATSSSSTKRSSFVMEREWEQLLGRVLSASIERGTYARTVIEVVVQVIQDDGSVLAAALHAAVAALLDAGVAMNRALPVATTCLIVENNSNPHSGTLLLDPTAQEERESSCDATLFVLVTESLDPGRVLATQSVSIGGSCTTKAAKMTLPNILACAQAASKSTQAVVTFWKLAMEQRAMRESQTLWSSS